MATFQFSIFIKIKSIGYIEVLIKVSDNPRPNLHLRVGLDWLMWNSITQIRDIELHSKFQIAVLYRSIPALIET